MTFSRRQFGKIALGSIPAASVLMSSPELFAAAKPNSKVNGVQIGMNIPYNFQNMTLSGDEILDKCVQLGLSGVELRAAPRRGFYGAASHSGPFSRRRSRCTWGSRSSCRWRRGSSSWWWRRRSSSRWCARRRSCSVDSRAIWQLRKLMPKQ